MKQTRTALTMLLSAYRSIFANSYLKGLACGVIATSVLAAGAAFAADLSSSLAASEEEVTSENAITAGSSSDTLSGSGYAYSLTVGSNYALTIASGNVSVVNGATAVDGTLSLASGSSLTVAIHNAFTADEEEEMATYDDVFQLLDYAQTIGSGTISIALGATLTFEQGYYELSDLTFDNSGSIVIGERVRVFLDGVESLKAMGSVDIQQVGDDDETGIVLTEEHSYMGQDLFGTNAVHSSTYNSTEPGCLQARMLTITSSTLNTYGVELQSNGDAYLTVDSDNNTFTFEGNGELGFQNGNVYLIDSNGASVSTGTIKLDGNTIFMGDYSNSDNPETYYVYADFLIAKGDLLIDMGNYVLQDVTITNGSFEVGDVMIPGTANVSMGTLTLNQSGSGSATVEIADNGSVTAVAVKASGGTIDVDGTLSVAGDGSNSTVDLSLSNGAILNLFSTGTLNLNDGADTVGLALSTGESGTFSVSDDHAQITSNGGTIEVDLSNVVSDELTVTQANSLFSLLASGTGLVKIDGADVDVGATYSEEYGGYAVDAETLGDMSFYTDSTLEIIVYNVTGSVTGGWQALVLAENVSSASVSENGTLIIAGATSNGNLVQAYDGSAAGLTLGNGANANLTGTGTIGAITGSDASLTVSAGARVSVEVEEGETAINVDSLTVSNAAVSTAGSVEAGELTVDSSSLQTGSITANSLDADGAQMIVAGDLTLSSGSESGSVADNNTSITVTGTATINHDFTVTANSSLTASKVEVGEDVTLQIGEEGEEDGSGTLEVQTLALNGGTLVLDPEFGRATAMAAVQSFTDSLDSGSDDLQTIDGNIIVGKNSALGVGMTLEELQSFISSYQVDGSLVEGSNYGSITVINSSGITISSGSQLVLGTAGIDELTELLTTYSSGNSIYFGAGSSLMFTAASLADDSESGTLNFEADSVTLYAAGGQIVVPAGITQTQLGKLITASNGSGSVSVSTVDGEDGLYFTTYNGLFTGELANGEKLSDLEMTLSDNARSILSGLSNPMYNYVIDSFNNDAFENAQGAGAFFLQDAVGMGNGSNVETAARLAVFGGAVQAAYLVEQETVNAIRARAGFTPASNLTVAENNGFGLWLAPVYRYLDASGFNADGLDAGAKIDLYGASLGADYAFADTARIGLMFSAGSGDADGKDAGSSVSNDFDYYSAGLYAVIAPVENFDILARFTYSKVDNDLNASSGLSDYGTLKTSVDSSALSFGVEARYTFKTDIVDIAPHLGLTYTKLKLDDYEVGSAQGNILKADNDNLDVFSIPLGVKFSSSLSAGDWIVSPAADLHVAFNTGDDKLDSNITFNGLENKVSLSTEVLDEFTYGIDLGISAQYQSFRLGLQLGYEGSDNTDSFGVMARAGYIF